MRVLVCGGRDFTSAEQVTRVLDAVHARAGVTVLVEGDAREADALAKCWALGVGIPVESYPANWQRYGLRAGRLRNVRMLREGRPDLVVAFPGGRAGHMVKIALEAGVRVVSPDFKDGRWVLARRTRV